MMEREHLTGSLGRGYTGRMVEGGIGVMEREVAPRPAPNTAEFLQKRQLETIAGIEAERAERRERRLAGEGFAKEHHGKEPIPPAFILKEHKDWSEIGWSREDISEIKAGLNHYLDLDDEHLQNALEILVAEGNTPTEVRRKLTDGTWNRITSQIKGTPLEAEHPDHKDTSGDPTNLRYGEFKAAKTFFLQEMIGREDYIKRFILTEDYRHENQVDYDQSNPSNLYELGWNIAHSQPEEFGLHGKFPVLEMRVERDKEGNVKGKYYVNQANLLRWERKWIMYQYDKEPDSVVNYFGEIKLDKQYRPVSLGEILDNTTRYFTDENGDWYGSLADQMLLEPWMMLTIRGYDVNYKQVMNSEEQLAKAMGDMFRESKLTKKTFSKSMLYFLSTMGVDFEGPQSDAKLGGAWTTMFLAYYNISDFAELQKVLGKDSSFFTKQGMQSALEYVSSGKASQTENPELNPMLGEKTLKAIDDMYDEDGKLKKGQEKAFTSFVNIFSSQWTDYNKADVIKTLLTNAVKEMYDFKSKEANPESTGDESLDQWSLDMAHLIAFSFLRFSGAGAKNDTGAAGYDAESKWMNTETYRRKMATEKRGGATGNPYTIPQFKGLLVDLMQGIRTTDAYTTKGVDGKTKARRKTPLEIMMELHESNRVKVQTEKELKAAMARETDAQKREELQQKLEKVEESGDRTYKQLAGQIEFPQLALANYAANHLQRGAKIYGQVMGAEEITFEKFVHHDVLKGVTFQRAEFHKAVQENFIKPLRYLWDTYGELDFSMPVRKSVFIGRDGDNDKYEYRTMPLGEALFGHQILDIPQFHKKGEDGKPLKDHNGKNVIDYNKVAEKPTLVYKQMALMKFAADMWTHIDRHSSDPSYGMAHYLEIIEALERIPAEISGNEYDMADTRVTKSFFSHDQIRWLRNISKTDNFSLYRRQFIDDLFGGSHDKKGSGLGDSFSLIVGAVFRGY